MVVNIMVNGNKIKLMATGLYIIQMEMFMMDSGLMIRRMGMANILILMELNTLDSGKTISSMVMELSSGWMGRNIKDNIKMVQKLEKVYLNF